MRAAYDGSALAWANGPGRVYERLADALVECAPVPLMGARVLDLGAGTGVASGAAVAKGAAQVVALDYADAMLPHGRTGITPVVGDGCALPFGNHSFDLVVSAFALSHFVDPLEPLLEVRRVSGALLASAFAADWTHPAKDAVENLLVDFGYQPPAWYLRVKHEGEPAVNDPVKLTRLARAAGFDDVAVHTLEVATGVDTAEELVSWRLGMAQVAPFVGSLSVDDRAALQHAAEAAVADVPPLVVEMLALAAR
ncbi:MAG TPA: methyltransferase domain-containing protein [Acidothermaceae bacterium]|nr:methyltransferase domain-containing protein [Acidothermaceae bacterium]